MNKELVFLGLAATGFVAVGYELVGTAKANIINNGTKRVLNSLLDTKIEEENKVIGILNDEINALKKELVDHETK